MIFANAIWVSRSDPPGFGSPPWPGAKGEQAACDVLAPPKGASISRLTTPTNASTPVAFRKMPLLANVTARPKSRSSNIRPPARRSWTGPARYVADEPLVVLTYHGD